MTILKVIRGSFIAGEVQEEPQLKKELSFERGGIVSERFFLFVPKHFTGRQVTNVKRRALEAIRQGAGA